MTEFQLLLIVASSFVGGAINSVAGGGTFLLFPALVFGGVTPFSANILCSIGLWPATISSAIAYRKQFTRLSRHMVALVIITLVGSAIGTFILLHTPEQTFENLIPWLLLMATCIFTFGRKFSFDRWRAPYWASVALQFVIAVYGGYFGAGMGILILAMLQLLGMRDIHAMNALKVVLATVVNLVAVTLFVMGGYIQWEIALWLIHSAIVGGYVGASLALRVKPEWVRHGVSAIGFAMTVYFFTK